MHWCLFTEVRAEMRFSYIGHCPLDVAMDLTVTLILVSQMHLHLLPLLCNWVGPTSSLMCPVIKDYMLFLMWFAMCFWSFEAKTRKSSRTFHPLRWSCISAVVSFELTQQKIWEMSSFFVSPSSHLFSVQHWLWQCHFQLLILECRITKFFQWTHFRQQQNTNDHNIDLFWNARYNVGQK